MCFAILDYTCFNQIKSYHIEWAQNYGDSLKPVVKADFGSSFKGQVQQHCIEQRGETEKYNAMFLPTKNKKLSQKLTYIANKGNQ